MYYFIFKECTTAGGQCVITVDGYYVETAFCFIYGIMWLLLCQKPIRKLQELPIEDWHVVKNSGHINKQS